jgi:nucleotide-binding universal stress UspA family protein
MFKRILVPIDLSDRNDRALSVALAVARQNRARVILVHVIQAVPDAQAAELRDFYERLEVTRCGRAVRPPAGGRSATRSVSSAAARSCW